MDLQQNNLAGLQNNLAGFLNVIIGLGILVGAVQCFFGYRIFKFILALTGFIIGAVLAGAVGHEFSHQVPVTLLAGFVGGFIGAVLLVALYFIGIFLFGAFLGGIVGLALFEAAQSNPEPAILIILALISGVVALVLQKFMIIASTSFGGAWNVIMGIAYFTTGAIDPMHIEKFFQQRGGHLYVMFLFWIALGIAGMIVQYNTAPPTDNKKQANPP
ncbi:MAG: TMEM198/TM7SF3 family protein [Gemmataceae bacterium]|nr:TMEM198/TM7SF3 family protein [Gemmataceae bacterium]